MKPTDLKVSGDTDYYEAVNTVYGMKDALRNYQDIQYDRQQNLDSDSF
jgi:hypothetical protein